MYRMQINDERTACARGQTRMDVAVAIGADPATMFSAILQLPPSYGAAPDYNFRLTTCVPAPSYNH
jgi:3-polyprenyl-4-hydroxybenzoate decarboxylase